jgi:hypothetical protein
MCFAFDLMVVVVVVLSTIFCVECRREWGKTLKSKNDDKKTKLRIKL